MLEARSYKILLFKIRSELSSAYVNQIDKKFSNILMRSNYALRTSNQKKAWSLCQKDPSLNDKQRKQKRCPQSVASGMNSFLQELLKKK